MGCVDPIDGGSASRVAPLGLMLSVSSLMRRNCVRDTVLPPGESAGAATGGCSGVIGAPQRGQFVERPLRSSPHETQEAKACSDIVVGRLRGVIAACGVRVRPPQGPEDAEPAVPTSIDLGRCALIPLRAGRL